MIIGFLFLAPLITADGINIGNAYDLCTGRAALSELRSGTAEQVADQAMAKCRHLEPRLREGLDRSFRTDRSGNVEAASEVSRAMTADSWDRLLKAKRDRLVQDIGRARKEFAN